MNPAEVRPLPFRWRGTEATKFAPRVNGLFLIFRFFAGKLPKIRSVSVDSTDLEPFFYQVFPDFAGIISLKLDFSLPHRAATPANRPQLTGKIGNEPVVMLRLEPIHDDDALPPPMRGFFPEDDFPRFAGISGFGRRRGFLPCRKRPDVQSFQRMTQCVFQRVGCT